MRQKMNICTKDTLMLNFWAYVCEDEICFERLKWDLKWVYHLSTGTPSSAGMKEHLYGLWILFLAGRPPFLKICCFIPHFFARGAFSSAHSVVLTFPSVFCCLLFIVCGLLNYFIFQLLSFLCSDYRLTGQSYQKKQIILPVQLILDFNFLFFSSL